MYTQNVLQLTHKSNIRIRVRLDWKTGSRTSQSCTNLTLRKTAGQRWGRCWRNVGRQYGQLDCWQFMPHDVATATVIMYLMILKRANISKYIIIIIKGDIHSAIP